MVQEAMKQSKLLMAFDGSPSKGRDHHGIGDLLGVGEIVVG